MNPDRCPAARNLLGIKFRHIQKPLRSPGDRAVVFNISLVDDKHVELCILLNLEMLVDEL